MDSDSDSTLDIAAAAVVVGVLLKRRKINKKRKSRNVWVKPWLQKRRELGVCDTLLLELRFREEQKYKKFLRMTSDNFDEILSLIENDIRKQDTTLREAIPPNIKLAATILRKLLCFLFRSL